jgi:hypothetical protein
VRLHDHLTTFRFAAEYGLSTVIPGIRVTSNRRSFILIRRRRLIAPRDAAASILLAACIHRPITLSPTAGETVPCHVSDLVQRISQLHADPNLAVPADDYDHHLNWLYRRVLALAAVHDLDLADFGRSLSL